ncbi:hypothetical protein GGR52DRAFT_282276 [Hypoxylon sp. FL1284]|nr:hypothetical protein GGR52DRAFT_282276 [Hypoxylon sp. FL1284]
MLVLGVLRRTHWASSRLDTLSLRNVASRGLRLRLTLRQNTQLSGLRFESTKPTPNRKADSRQPPPPRFAYPERLCVYHAGTARITFLACLKISTLFIFVFLGFVVMPAYYERDGLSPTVLRTTLSAAAPMVFVAYITSPFVSFIHMRLPTAARGSEDMLRRFLRSIPPKTELTVTTMSFIAKPRVSNVRLEELFPANKRFGIVNLARDTATDNASRKWYMFRAVGDFCAPPANNTTRTPWVWESILGTIRNGS